MRYPTKTCVKKRTSDRLVNMLESFPCARPYPSVSGMKKLYWGEDALCVKCGAYVYKVDRQTYDMF